MLAGVSRPGGCYAMLGGFLELNDSPPSVRRCASVWLRWCDAMPLTHHLVTTWSPLHLDTTWSPLHLVTTWSPLHLFTWLLLLLRCSCMAGLECEHLAGERELACQCGLAPAQLSLALLVASHPQPLESLRLTGCTDLQLQINTVNLTQPFYQVCSPTSLVAQQLYIPLCWFLFFGPCVAWWPNQSLLMESS